MGRYILCLALTWIWCGTLKAAPWDLPNVLRDPKTKVTYRMESDRRHLSATDSNGKLLWRSNVVSRFSPGTAVNKTWIVSWGFWPYRRLQENQNEMIGGDNYLSVTIRVWNEGFVWGSVDKKTGKFYGILVS